CTRATVSRIGIGGVDGLRRSGSTADMFLLEQITNDLRLALAAIQLTPRAGHHLRAVAWAACSHGVGFDVLIEQLMLLMRVQFGASRACGSNAAVRRSPRRTVWRGPIGGRGVDRQ